MRVVEGTSFSVTFVDGAERSTRLIGRGSVVVDAHGVRFVGARPRIDAAFYGACVIALVAAVLSFWIATLVAGRQVLSSIMGARPLLFGAGVCALGVLTAAHGFLIRVLPLAREDRHVAFSEALRADVLGDGVMVTSTARGFAGATSFTFDGGADASARFLDELETARAGGARTYRSARAADEPADLLSG